MKNQALFSLKDKSKRLKCHLLQVLFGTIRVNTDRSCYKDVLKWICKCKAMLT